MRLRLRRAPSRGRTNRVGRGQYRKSAAFSSNLILVTEIHHPNLYIYCLRDHECRFFCDQRFRSADLIPVVSLSVQIEFRNAGRTRKHSLSLSSREPSNSFKRLVQDMVGSKPYTGWDDVALVTVTRWVTPIHSKLSVRPP